MKKSLLFWIYFVLSILLAIYFSSRIITNYLGRGPISYIKHVKITSTTKDMDLEPIGVAVGIRHGTSLRSLDLHQINNRVMSVPGIKNASTRRMPNGNLIIKTQPYTPVAMWTDGALYYPLADDGTRIDTPFEKPTENTIVFSGKIPNSLADIIASASIISEYIDYMNMIESRRWNIHTKTGITIYLPEDNPSIAINKINILNQTHKLLSRDIEIIDMRDDTRILIKTRK
ncbi:MAG: cell division protein FtsQ/DivIB [Alphaproteobacteria bacterium]|nr:cell division protein FtsQ/DivIB [Alphaproteobacteria bacterium]